MGALDSIEKAVNDSEAVSGNFDLNLTPEEEAEYRQLAAQKKKNANLESGDNDFNEDDYSLQLDGTDVNGNLDQYDLPYIDSNSVSEGGIKLNPNPIQYIPDVGTVIKKPNKYHGDTKIGPGFSTIGGVYNNGGTLRIGEKDIK